MTPQLEQRLQQIAAENGYSWPAGEIAAAMRMAAEAALESAIEYIESSAKRATHVDHKVGIYVAAAVVSQLLPPTPKEHPNDRD